MIWVLYAWSLAATTMATTGRGPDWLWIDIAGACLVIATAVLIRDVTRP